MTSWVLIPGHAAQDVLGQKSGRVFPAKSRTWAWTGSRSSSSARMAELTEQLHGGQQRRPVKTGGHLIRSGGAAASAPVTPCRGLRHLGVRSQGFDPEDAALLNGDLVPHPARARAACPAGAERTAAAARAARGGGQVDGTPDAGLCSPGEPAQAPQGGGLSGGGGDGPRRLI